MVSNSDLQKWQAAVNGINAAGQQELTGEEWAALVALNNSLQSGNFESDESRRAFSLLKDSLSRHNNNQLLQVHLKNFVDLFNKYSVVHQGSEVVSPISKSISTGMTSTQQANTSGQTKKSGSNSLQIIIIAAIILGVAYYFVKDSDWFANLFSGKTNTEIEVSGEQTDDYAQYEQKETISNKQAINKQAIIDSMAHIVDSLQKIKNTPPDTRQPQNINSAISGRFPHASERLLTASDLQYLSKEDLRIMRNEIFARHGYIFQTQAMKTYFQNQSWYSPRYNNVNSMLSSIEQKNIALIQRYE